MSDTLDTRTCSLTWGACLVRDRPGRRPYVLPHRAPPGALNCWRCNAPAPLAPRTVTA